MKQESQIVNIKKFNLIGLEIELTSSQDKNYILIHNLWKKFNLEMRKIKAKRNDNWEKFGVTYRKNKEVYYLASIERPGKKEVPINMINKRIKQGKYICFNHTGAINTIKTTIYNIYKKIIPELELKIESMEKADLIHFERYDNRFKWNDPKSIVEIYLPVEQSKR